MKKLLTLIAICLLVFAGIGCSDGGSDGGGTSSSSDPEKIANDYLAKNDIDITSKKGDSYSGNYFPFIAGNSWQYQGSGLLTLYSSNQIKFQGETQSETNGPTDRYVSLTARMEIQPAREITLNDGVYTLYPVAEYSENYVMGSASSAPSPEISRYFEKKDGNVYIRAIQPSGGSIIKVENPVYLKSTLIVGDAWSSEPVIDIDQYLDESYIQDDFLDSTGLNMDFSFDAPQIKSTFVVIGEEPITISGHSIDTVRVDQVVTASLTGQGSVSGSEDGVHYTADFDVNMDLDEATKLFFQEDVGIVRNDEILSFDIEMDLTIKANSETLTMNMVVSADGDSSVLLSNSNVTLDSYAANKNSDTEDIAQDSAAVNTGKQFSITKTSAVPTDQDENGDSNIYMNKIAKQIESQTKGIMAKMIRDIHLQK